MNYYYMTNQEERETLGHCNCLVSNPQTQDTKEGKEKEDERENIDDRNRGRWLG